MKNIISSLAVLAFLAGTGCESQKNNLRSETRISQDEARQIALAKAPGGSVKEAELEKEHGKLVWSFDIARVGTTDITEVLVDAKTGAIVSVQNESAEQEAKEKLEEEKEHHHDKAEKEDDEKEDK